MKINPPYKHLVQKPHCCGPTCLQMILFRRGHWIDQGELALKLGTKIKSKSIQFFNHDFEIDDNNTGIPLLQFIEIADFLKQFNLQAKVIKVSEIENFKKLIIENLEKNNDLIVNFHHLAYNPDRNSGHFALINSLNNNQIEIWDPSYHSKAYWKTSLTKLQQAMTDKWDGKERGLVIVSHIQKRGKINGA